MLVCLTGDQGVGGCGFDPHQVRQHSLLEINYEIFSIILFLPLIQDGQLSVSDECAQILFDCLED